MVGSTRRSRGMIWTCGGGVGRDGKSRGRSLLTKTYLTDKELLMELIKGDEINRSREG